MLAVRDNRVHQESHSWGLNKFSHDSTEGLGYKDQRFVLAEEPSSLAYFHSANHCFQRCLASNPSSRCSLQLSSFLRRLSPRFQRNPRSSRDRHSAVRLRSAASTASCAVHALAASCRGPMGWVHSKHRFHFMNLTSTVQFCVQVPNCHLR